MSDSFTSLDLSTDTAIQSALLSLISGTSSTMSVSDALRRVNTVSKRMMDTVLLREALLSISDDPWMPDVAKGIFVEKKVSSYLSSMMLFGLFQRRHHCRESGWI